jgi:hypothetical protein
MEKSKKMGRAKFGGDFFINSSGVDVMITIFCDFSQLSAKKLAFFLNTIVMITFLSKFAFVFNQKRQFFR